MMPIRKKIAAAVLVPFTPLTSSASFFACSASVNSSFKDAQEKSLSESLVVSITFGVEQPMMRGAKDKVKAKRIILINTPKRKPPEGGSSDSWWPGAESNRRRGSLFFNILIRAS